MLKGHGDDIHDYEGRIKSNFSSNMYNGQDLSHLQNYLCKRIKRIHSYPEPDARSLASLLAQKHAIQTENVCVTNGAAEAIYLIAQAFRNSRTAIIIPTFSEYEDACRINEYEITYSTSLSQLPKGVELVWLCNPNNPTGSAYNKNALKEFITNHPDIYFIVDQSYEAFVDQSFVLDTTTAVRHKNLILLHSMTKKYAIPGLRLGYLTAHADLVRKVVAYRMPWSVNGLAVEAGKFLIENPSPLLNINDYLQETKRLQGALSLIAGLMVYPTHTHFFLCKLEHKKACDLKQYLIDNHGILIRDAANFRGLDEHYFRLATQSRDENDTLVKAIREWI